MIYGIAIDGEYKKRLINRSSMSRFCDIVVSCVNDGSCAGEETDAVASTSSD